MKSSLKTVVVGLGNPVLGDDGVGWRIVEHFRQHMNDIPSTQGLDFICLGVGGLSLMEHLVGYDRAILLDAVNLGRLPVGDLYCLPLADLPDHSTGHMGSAHDTSLATAMQLGQSMGLELPKEVWIIGVESQNVYDFSEDLTPPVAAAVPRAAALLQSLLQGNHAHTEPTD
jgi:hydrogenase maturation protease